MKEESDKGAFGMLIVAIGVMVLTATIVVHTIFEIWQMQYGMLFGTIIVFVGTAITVIKLKKKEA